MNFRKAGQFGAQILITGSSLVSQLFKRLHPFSKNSILSKEAINFVAVLIQAKCPFKPSRFQTKGVVLVFRLILAISAIGSFRQSQTAGYRHAVSRRVGGLKDRQGQVRQGARTLPGAPGSLPTKRAAAKHDDSRDCGAGGVGEKRCSGLGSAAANRCHFGHRRQAFAVR